MKSTTPTSRLTVFALAGGLLLPATCAPAQTPLFAPAPGSPVAVAGGPGNLALGDVNGDGAPDLVVAGEESRSLTVLLGQGDGQFRPTPQGPVSVPDPPHEMALGDVDGNGALDLAVATHDSYGVMLLLGDGEGGFSVARHSPIVMKEGRRPHTHGLAMGDLNHDGLLDLVTVNNEDNDVSAALGDGRGGFAPAPGSPFAVGPGPYPLALGDVNGDGHLDVAATTTAFGRSRSQLAASSRALTLLMGDGQGGFRRDEVALRTPHPWFVALGDVNGDGQADIVATHAERSALTVLMGEGAGRFTEAGGSPFDLGRTAWGVALVDANRDGQADVVAAAGDGVRVMLGDGQGGFEPAPGAPFPTGDGAWRLARGDVNGDGKPDVATSNSESDNVTVLLAQ